MLLGKVDGCQKRLEKIPHILKRFRQSVLAAAFNNIEEKVKLKELLREPLANGRSVITASKGFPVLRLTCLKSGRIDLSENKIGYWSEEEAKNYLV